MRRVWMVAWMVAAVLVTWGSNSAAAQGRPLNAFGRQDLTFGALIPGIPVTVSRLDAANAGQFEVRGMRLTEVRIDLTLPRELLTGSGASVPLEFGPGDGGYATSPSLASSQAFDPRVPLLARLPGNGRLYIWLGGTARPSAQQRAGTYAAIITLTSAYTGN